MPSARKILGGADRGGDPAGTARHWLQRARRGGILGAVREERRADGTQVDQRRYTDSLFGLGVAM